MGGFPTIRHNELRDVTASLLSDVCHNVATEPRLQPLSEESLTYRTTITADNARLDIRARGFWSIAQDAYFDVRVFHPNAPSNRSGSLSLSTAYKKHEDVKKRAYGQRIRDVEGGVFTPLVFFPPLGGWDASDNFLQKAGRYARLKTTEAVPRSHQLAKMQAILRCRPIAHHVHPWDKILQQQTTKGRRYYPRNI